MHKEAAARVTLRTVDQLDELATTRPPAVLRRQRLGEARPLRRAPGRRERRRPDRRGRPEGEGRAHRRRRTGQSGPRDLGNRLTSPGARQTTDASRRIREALAVPMAVRSVHAGDRAPARPAAGSPRATALDGTLPDWAAASLAACPGASYGGRRTPPGSSRSAYAGPSDGSATPPSVPAGAVTHSVSPES